MRVNDPTLSGFDPAGAGGGGLITSSTPISTGYDPAAGGVQYGSRQTGATRADLIKQYGNMKPAFRKALAQKLKDAGYRIPVTGSYSTLVREAFLSANEGLSQEIVNIQQNDPDRLLRVGYDLNTYLDDLSVEGGAGEPSVTEYPSVLSKGDVAELLNAVKQDLTGYGATDDEVEFYYQKLRNKALKQPTVVTQTDGRQVTEGGFNPRQFLIEKISATDAAKERKVLDAYDAFAEVFGINL